jgi:uncharacterized membrane protein (DUF106 family)
MDIFSELLRNVLATLVSTVTIVIMFFRFMNRERLQHAKQIAEKTAKHVFNTATLEHRVANLEKTEKEQAESIDKQFALVHSRLDQIYSIIAGLNK